MNTVREILETEFHRIRSQNQNYSLRAFARKLGVTPTALSQVFNHKRSVTTRFGTKVLMRLNYDPATVGKILRTQSSRAEMKVLTMDEFILIRDWYHFAIFELSRTREFRADPKWVAKRLGIPVMKARVSIKKLITLGLLVKTEKGGTLTTGKMLSIQSPIPCDYLRNHHRQTVGQIQLSLDRDLFEACDFSSSTVAIDLRKIGKAKKMIKEFRRKLARYLAEGEATEVYKVFLGMFPVTKFDQTVLRTSKGESDE